MYENFVQVVAVATGQKQLVPKDWLGHPVLGRGIRLPLSALADTDTPNPNWRKADIEGFASSHGIDLPAGATRVEMVEVITAAIATDVAAEEQPVEVDVAPEGVVDDLDPDDGEQGSDDGGEDAEA